MQGRRTTRFVVHTLFFLTYPSPGTHKGGGEQGDREHTMHGTHDGGETERGARKKSHSTKRIGAASRGERIETPATHEAHSRRRARGGRERGEGERRALNR